MAQYAVSFLLTSLVMSAIILMVLAFNALFPKVFTAKLRYAVWLVILIGLIIPLRPMIGDGLFTIPLPATEQTQLGSYESTQIAESLPEADSTQDMPKAGENTDPGRTVSPILICTLIWGAVAVVIFTYHILRYIRFIRMVRRWGTPVKDKKTKSLLWSAQEANELGGKDIALVVCGVVSSSILTGFFRPMILLPEKHFDEDELELIFKHELIHYKRHDLIVKLLNVIVISLHWFNPIVYWMCAAMQTDGEASCDEAVLQDTEALDRKFYAEVIMGMIGGKNKARTLLSTCFYGGKSSIKKRLDSIMDTSRKMKKPTVIVLVAVAVLTVLSGSVFALTGEPSIIGTPSFTPEPDVTSKISLEQAEDIALATVGGGTITYSTYEILNEQEVYNIEVIYGDKKYSMVIDAVLSAVMDYRVESIEIATPPVSGETQTPDDTPAPASTDSVPTNTPEPNATQSPVTAEPTPASTPTPATPQAETTSPPQQASTEITAERAKEIALAKVGGGTVTECKLDYENGRKVYEIKIVYGNTKYEMDVDAIDGSISDYSAETKDHDDDHDD